MLWLEAEITQATGSTAMWQSSFDGTPDPCVAGGGSHAAVVVVPAAGEHARVVPGAGVEVAAPLGGSYRRGDAAFGTWESGCAGVAAAGGEGRVEKPAAGGCREDEAHALSDFVLWLSVRAAAASEARSAADARAVTLTTLHRSKGREWDHVFVVDAGEGQLPLRPPAGRAGGAGGTGGGAAGGSVDDDDEAGGGAAEAAEGGVAEERRLLYVGMTRAKRTLCMSWAATDAQGRPSAASPFLAELPVENCRWGVVRGCVVGAEAVGPGEEAGCAEAQHGGGERGLWSGGVRVEQHCLAWVLAAAEAVKGKVAIVWHSLCRSHVPALLRVGGPVCARRMASKASVDLGRGKCS